jgi:hypothetical protein
MPLKNACEREMLSDPTGQPESIVLRGAARTTCRGRSAPRVLTPDTALCMVWLYISKAQQQCTGGRGDSAPHGRHAAHSSSSRCDEDTVK